MQPHREGQGLRRVSYWVLVAVFATLSIYAAQRAYLIQLSMEESVQERAQEELERLIAIWERATLDRVNSWLVDAAETSDLRAAERHHRRTSTFFEAYHVWEPTPTGPKILHPGPPVEENLEALMATPCLQRAARMSNAASPLVTAEQFERCTEADNPQVAALAVSRAADLYLTVGNAAAALAVLEKGPIPLLFPLSNAEARGISVYRLVAMRLQAAQAAAALGDLQRAGVYLRRTGQEIVDLDGRALEILLPFVDYPILTDLRGIGESAAAARLEIRAIEARRRLLGYLEVVQRIGQEAYPTSSEHGDIEPQIALAYDQYGDRTYLLAYAPTSEAGKMAAVQLDQLSLIGSMLNLARPSLRQHLVVMTATGELVLEGRPGAARDELWFQVPFASLLPHLRLGIGMEAASTAGIGRSFAAQLLPVLIVVFLGAFGLLTRAKADRRLRELVDRQQAFVARVTHELKTPLAGIKLMAETLEMGAGDDPEKRARFLERIIGETDRLTDRIDEVLRAAKQTSAASMQPLRLDAVVEEVLERWRPRLEQAGFELTVSLTETPLVPGDRALVADAVGNLIDNALKYRHPKRLPQLVVRTHGARRSATVEVIDNGIGVPANQRKAIFQPFTRVEGAGRGKAGGHGLGLAFVMDTARQHGGTVEAREGIDGGTRFVFTIRRPRWKSLSQL